MQHRLLWVLKRDGFQIGTNFEFEEEFVEELTLIRIAFGSTSRTIKRRCDCPVTIMSPKTWKKIQKEAEQKKQEEATQKEVNANT